MKIKPARVPNFVTLDYEAPDGGEPAKVPLSALSPKEFEQFANDTMEAMREAWGGGKAPKCTGGGGGGAQLIPHGVGPYVASNGAVNTWRP